ncbi:MAG: hypothetical protein M1816_003971 [Peltula sp. TS41687]|nr:MAG: hypothetical protein M1816_003971 [Peltula sp. TS41687]
MTHDMENGQIDLAQLSERQQLALQQFTSVANQELEAAIPVLQRSEWNAQIAITKFFDGESANIAEDSDPTYDVPRASRSRETLLDGSSSPNRLSPSYRHLTPAPRITPQSESQVNRQPPFILGLLLIPLNLLYRLVSKPLGLFAYLFPFLSRIFSSSGSGLGSGTTSMQNSTERPPLNPQETASRFIREFEEEYGSSSLPLYENGYAQALDLAKKDLKFLLVILVSPEHDDTSFFISHTLLSQEVVNYLTDSQNQIILWAGSVQDSEAYQVAAALDCTKFPFAALITHTPQVSSTSMSVVARIVGPTPHSTFLAKLREAITQHSVELDRARATKASREAERNLRQQQNSAYERSLAQDRERARQKREAEAARLRAEKEALKKQEAREQLIRQREQWKRWRVQSLSPEPGPGEKGCIKVSLRMPSGTRVIRRFSPEVDMEGLYAFVECHDLLDAEENSSKGGLDRPKGYEHRYGFRLISPMPRTEYTPEAGVSIGARVGKNSNLIVESFDDDDDDDEDDNEE